MILLSQQQNKPVQTWKKRRCTKLCVAQQRFFSWLASWLKIVDDPFSKWKTVLYLNQRASKFEKIKEKTCFPFNNIKFLFFAMRYLQK